MNTTIYISYFSYCPIYLSERAMGGRIGFDLRLWMGESITVEEAGQGGRGTSAGGGPHGGWNTWQDFFT